MPKVHRPPRAFFDRWCSGCRWYWLTTHVHEPADAARHTVPSDYREEAA